MTKRSADNRERIKFTSDFLDFFSDRHAETQAAFFINYVKSGMKILDCGCGPGSINLDFAEIVAPEQAIGIDIEPAHIEKGKTLQEKWKVSNIEFQAGDINKLPFEEQYEIAV